MSVYMVTVSGISEAVAAAQSGGQWQHKTGRKSASHVMTSLLRVSGCVPIWPVPVYVMPRLNKDGSLTRCRNFLDNNVSVDSAMAMAPSSPKQHIDRSHPNGVAVPM